MLSNPPYGKSWKTDAEKMGGKKEILDTRFNTYLEGGEAMPMIPRTSDGQLLFVLNNVAKMKKDTPLGSRIAEVHNGSSLFTGDAGSGESNARRYLIENDLVEAIIALPENMFYNTGIGTFIWILSNKKEERRKGKIQLIDASKMKSPLRKNMGKKNCEFTADIRADILRIFMEMEESEVSRIFNNDEFGYWSITVDRPLRQKVTVNVETIKQTLAMFKTLYGIDVEHEEDVIATVAPSDILSFTQNYSNVRVVKMPKTFGQEQTEQIYRMYMKALIDFVQEEPYMDYNAFIEKFYKNLHIKNNPFKFKKFEDFMYPLLEKDEKAEVVYDKGKPVVDMELRDTEIVPFTYEGGIDAFMKNEVLTYAPDAFVDGKKTTVGYEISFTKYFYKPVELREMSEILADLNALEQQADGMLASIMEGIL
jgi:type I restriction enzyme M protein